VARRRPDRLQFVLNFEEGAENCVLDGDPASEVFLSEIVNAQAFPMRHMSMESLYEYGSRAGLWRVLRAFERHRLPLTVFAVAAAVRRHAEAAAAFKELGHEIACHGLRWISYQQVDEATERAHMARRSPSCAMHFGTAPLGWYTGRDSPQTRRLLVEHGGLVYDSDSYADDLPYWTEVTDRRRRRSARRAASGGALCARYQRHALCHRPGLQFGDAVLRLSAAAFDTLYREGDPNGLDAPKMLSVGLHCRLAGRPGRIAALERFLEYVLAAPARVDLPPHRYRPALDGRASVPAGAVIGLSELNALPSGEFVIAAWRHLRAFALGRAERARRPAVRLAAAIARCDADRRRCGDARARAAGTHPRAPATRCAAQPCLKLTEASAREQRRAGLDACTPEEAARLEQLNAAYLEKFGFPFIIAVRGHDPASIIAHCERRLKRRMIGRSNSGRPCAK
jgi:allantoinase